jgi:hypothetical protein
VKVSDIKMESDSTEESRGRFKVSAASPPETSVGRFRLIPQGSPFLHQRGRFSVIPEEETGSPLTQTKLSGPKIVVEASPEWDFVSIKMTMSENKSTFANRINRGIRKFQPLFPSVDCKIGQSDTFHSSFSID